MANKSADWFEDPTGRHQYRYWDGKRWTDDVADDGVQGGPTQWTTRRKKAF